MRDRRNGRLMKPIGAPEGGGEWSWVMSVFRPATPKWCSKCMEAKVLTRLGMLSGSVVAGDLQGLQGAVAGWAWVGLTLEAVRGSSDGRDKGMSDRRTEKAALLVLDRKSTPTADRTVRRCVVSSSTNAAAPTDTINVASRPPCARTRLPSSHGAFRHCRSYHALSASPCARACYWFFPPARDLIQIHRVIALLSPSASTLSFQRGHQIDLGAILCRRPFCHGRPFVFPSFRLSPLADAGVKRPRPTDRCGRTPQDSGDATPDLASAQK